ncbi:MAG: hypothetical protein EXX96DRAFT_536450 [Benjaminiella poitrasii]|nr:MAG: hypothetical protein EXX96DRAFT_536450 [Benjaminiella poitrasii]
MHELVRNEKKKEDRAQTRTGPTSLPDKIKEKQQNKVAASAMAQMLRRRREPRSMKMWEDRKKAAIKRYPDGRQEIIVPQILTLEQKHYQFPPRSKLLKRLANSIAERRRLSALHSHLSGDIMSHPPGLPDATSPEIKQQPDELALQQWFSKNKDDKPLSKANKERAVIDWMNEVERSSKSLLSPTDTTITTKKKHPHPIKPLPSLTPSSCFKSHQIEFKSESGRRWANNIITNTTSYLPPDETCRKHCVSRKVLVHLPRLQSHDREGGNKAASTELLARVVWEKEEEEEEEGQNLKSTSTPSILARKDKARSSTKESMSTAGMMQLIQMLHHSLRVEQQKSNERLTKLESLLKEETKKRQEAEERMKRLETIYQQQRQQHLTMSDGNTTVTSSTFTPEKEEDKTYQSLLSRLNELEQSFKCESQSRKAFEEQLLNSTTLSSLSMPYSAVPKQSLGIHRNTATKTNSNKRSLVPTTNNPIKPLPIDSSTNNSTRRLRDRTSSLASAGITRRLATESKLLTTAKNVSSVKSSGNNIINPKRPLATISVPRSNSPSRK